VGLSVLIGPLLDYPRVGLEGVTPRACRTEHQTPDYRFINLGFCLLLDDKVSHHAFFAGQWILDTNIGACRGIKFQRFQ
jgi:hypothetical protein